MDHRRVPAWLAGAASVIALGLGPPAVADDDGDDYGQCKYVCADKLIICVQPDSCHFGNDKNPPAN